MQQLFGHCTNSATLHIMMTDLTSEKLATKSISIDYTYLLKYKSSLTRGTPDTLAKRNCDGPNLGSYFFQCQTVSMTISDHADLVGDQE